MKFVKVENINIHEEMVINLEHISVLAKNVKFERDYSDLTPYPSFEMKEKENEFDYIVVIDSSYSFKVNKEDYELIKSKMGV